MTISKYEGSRIHETNLKPNQKYFLRTKSGEALVETIELFMDGWQVTIIEGGFQPIGAKRIGKGAGLLIQNGMGSWYELKG